jgi:Fe-S-cluster containining protein
MLIQEARRRKAERKDLEETEQMVAEIQKKQGIRRVGQCNGCGKCCSMTMNVMAIDTEHGEVYPLARRDNECCEFLDKETKKCKAYDRRPAICRVYPCTPLTMMEGCGYQFEKVEKEK